MTSMPVGGRMLATKADDLRRARTAGGVAALALSLSLFLLGSVASALALGSAQVKVGEPLSEEAPAIAVDSAGTAYIAWADTKDVAGALPTVQYCVLPAGASACAHSGTLAPADSAQEIDRVQVLVDGSTIVVLADVYGTAGESETASEYIPEQEWQSTNGGASFAIVDEGKSVAAGIIDADTAPLGAVIVPGADALGYAWDTAGSSPPTFDEFPLAAPPPCSVEKCPAEEAFASLEPDTNPDQIGNAGGVVASQVGSNAGVLGIYETDFSNGPLGCSGAGTASFGTAFAYGSGAQGAGNSYDVSPGTAGSAWKVPVTQADCDVEYPAVAGGPSGFGVLEDNLGTSHVVYQRFDEKTSKFDIPAVTVADEFEEQPAVSQDGKGGLYATFLGGGAGGPISLAYSSDGGDAWVGPAVLAPDSEGNVGHLTSSVDAGGKGWATWTANGSVYAQPFDAADAIVPATVGSSATSTSTSVTVTITCASVPCTVTVTITISASEASAARVKKPKQLTIATGKFTIHKHGAQKLAVHLSKAGRKLLARHHGHLSATLLAAEKLDGLKAQTTKRIKIAPAKRG